MAVDGSRVNLGRSMNGMTACLEPLILSLGGFIYPAALGGHRSASRSKRKRFAGGGGRLVEVRGASVSLACASSLSLLMGSAWGGRTGRQTVLWEGRDMVTAVFWGNSYYGPFLCASNDNATETWHQFGDWRSVHIPGGHPFSLTQSCGLGPTSAQSDDHGFLRLPPSRRRLERRRSRPISKTQLEMGPARRWIGRQGVCGEERLGSGMTSSGVAWEARRM